MTSRLGKHSVRIEMLNQYLNWHESGSGGRVMSGTIHAYLEPMLSLQVESTNRTVMQMRKPNSIDDIPINQAQARSRNKYVYKRHGESAPLEIRR